MFKPKPRAEIRRAVHDRIRKRVEGTPNRPRLCVYRSLNHIYAQVIDDSKGATICSLIAVPDMVFVANELNVTFFTPFEVFSAVAIILIVLVFIFSAGVYLLERRLRIA